FVRLIVRLDLLLGDQGHLRGDLAVQEGTHRDSALGRFTRQESVGNQRVELLAPQDVDLLLEPLKLCADTLVYLLRCDGLPIHLGKGQGGHVWLCRGPRAESEQRSGGSQSPQIGPSPVPSPSDFVR